MRLLITGSSGQIGTNLALHCLANGHEVVGLDRRPNPWTDRFETTLMDLDMRRNPQSRAGASAQWRSPPAT